MKIEIIPPTKEPEGDWMKPMCDKGHVWGDGKSGFRMDEICPECGGVVVGFKERRTMPYSDFKNIFGSSGTFEVNPTAPEIL